jgi:hypothetical protein
VLPDRIELSTSPLPMECSTTELRQHARDRDRIGPKGPQQAGRFLPQAPRWRKHAVTPKRPRNGAKAQGRWPPAACLSWASSGPIRFCVSSASAMSALARRIRDLEMRSFRRLHHVFRQQRSPRVAMGRGDRAVPAVEGLLWPRAPVHIFAHRRFFADDGIKTGPR